MDTPLLSVTDLVKAFDVRRSVIEKLMVRRDYFVHALAGVSFDLHCGEALGLIGESGCGKSTLAKILMRLQQPTSGTVALEGRTITAAREDVRVLRRRMQIILQDPYASLNPRKSVEEIVSLPLLVRGERDRTTIRGKVVDMLDRVGLGSGALSRYPHQFSGGQRQRISIARALIGRPEIVICDEPVSALDASIQAQVLELLADLQREFGLTYLFISHNLAVVGHLCNRVAVMYAGRIVEIGDVRDVLLSPRHPYTRILLSALPRLNRSAPRIIAPEPQEARSTSTPMAGCSFQLRCPRVQNLCRGQIPALALRGGPHPVACHFVEQHFEAASEGSRHG